MIPTWNGREILERNLPSVRSALEAYPEDGEVLVVDDGSQDGTMEWLARTHLWVRAIRRASNEGFGAAVNAGAGAARGRLIVLLNNDMRVERDFLSPLTAPFSSGEGLFSTTPRIFNRSFGGDEAVTACTFRRGIFETVFLERQGPGQEADPVQKEADLGLGENRDNPAARAAEETDSLPGGAREPDAETRERGADVRARDAETRERNAETQERDAKTRERDAETQERDAKTRERDAETREWDAEARERDAEAREPDAEARETMRSAMPPPTSEVLFACGGAAAFDRSLWLALGGLDPLFAPFYWEDVDLSWRARKRGWRILHVPESVVHHEHSATIGARFDRRKVIDIYERNRLLFQWKNLTSPRLTASHLAWLPFRLARAIVTRREFLRGFAMALSRMGEARRARRFERTIEKLPDEAILESFRAGPRR